MSTVALTIDYSNGAQKHFSNIPWEKDLTILGAIQASAGIPPGATISFGSDRVGHVLKLVIDEMPREDTMGSEWVVWVNAKPFQSRLGTDTSFGFRPDEREANLLNPGDHVLIKLSVAAEKPACERLTGFVEGGYDDTRSRLEVVGRELRSRINGHSYGIGELELVSLRSLRERASSGAGLPHRMTVRNVSGDVRHLHQSPEYAGALFQVASQFNLLEMVSPEVAPEHGVTRYQHDKTQGPACAIAAGAGTIYRNYFVPVGGECGQTSNRQLDGLAEIGVSLGLALGRPVGSLWTMRNGYALCSREGLAAIDTHLSALSAAEADALGALLRIGAHRDVEVTQGELPRRQFVSQAFCSALPVGYTSVAPIRWRSFAELVLEAAYEATLWAAVLNARRGASNIVLLTRLGGGAFGNDDAWIDAAMRRALTKVQDCSLDVRLVSFGAPPPSMLALKGFRVTSIRGR